MIRFQNVSKIYPTHSDQKFITALQDVSFDIKEKEFVSIVGKSGAGKTTLFKLLIAEEKPTQGKIFFEDIDINKIARKELGILRKKIGVVFQNYELFFSKTAYENIAFVMEIMGVQDKDIRRDVEEVLKIVGLFDRANSFPKEFSEGEKQRLAIGRALIHQPKIILADEPTGNLDPYYTRDIIKLLHNIYETGTTVILSTHDKEVVNNLGQRVITLEQGKLIRDEEEGKYIL